MTKFLVDNPNRFYITAYSLENFLKGELEAIRLFTLLKTTYNMLQNSNKLQEDGSFYLSYRKICDITGLTRRKFERGRKVLLDKNLIEIDLRVIEDGKDKYKVQFYRINVDLYNKIILEGNASSLTIADISQNLAEEEKLAPPPAIAKNETADEPAPPPALKDQETKIIEVKDDYSARIMDAWNKVAEINGLPKIILLKEERIKKFKAVIKYLNLSEKDFFNSINSALKESKFLRGYGQKWRADFDFFLSKQKALKAIEGGYRDNTNELIEKLSDVQTISHREAQDMREKMLIEKDRRQDKERREAKQEAKSLPS